VQAKEKGTGKREKRSALKMTGSVEQGGRRSNLKGGSEGEQSF